MPSIKEGESEKDYVSRCIPIRMKEKGESSEKAAAACHGMYRQHKKKGTQYTESNKEEYIQFTLDCPLVEYKSEKKIELKDDKCICIKELTDPKEIEEAEKKREEFLKNQKTEMINQTAIALKGDEFYKECYLPASELEKAYKGWEGTLHDINHMGTTHLMGLGVTSDIRYFVGYQDNVKYDPETKKVAMDIHVDEQTQYGKTWKAYVNLCKKAGRVANVSVTFLAKRGTAKAKDIVYNYNELGFKGEETVTYIKDIKPVALSTVLKGACSDDKGCGIGQCPVQQSEESVTSTKTDKEIQAEKEYEQEKQKLIEELKKLDKEEEK
jgi:hypothetical protein